MLSDTDQSSRSSMLDALRGIAVFGMILAHAIFFFHNATNPALIKINSLANTVVFTIFVFVAGAAVSRVITSSKYLHFAARMKRALDHAGIIYLGYVITGVAGVLTTTPHFTGDALVSRMLGAITMLQPINFTEYMPFFIILNLIFPFVYRFYQKLQKSLILTLAVAAISYVLGLLLFPISLPPVLNEIKELFAGGKDVLRFPVFYYLPVYLIGLWWENTKELSNRPKMVYRHLIVLLFSLAIMTGGLIISGRFDVPLLSLNMRWPPSIGFLAVGLSAAAATIFLSKIIPKPHWLRLTYGVSVYLGRDAYDLWTAQLLIVFLYRDLIGVQFASVGAVLLLFILLLLSSISFASLAIFNPIGISHIGRYTMGSVISERLRGKYSVAALAAIIVFIWILLILPIRSQYGTSMQKSIFAVYDNLSPQAIATISADRQWYLRHSPENKVKVTLKITNSSGKNLSINPDNITFKFGENRVNAKFETNNHGNMIYSLDPIQIKSGNYNLSAAISDGLININSNKINIIVSEPLMVAWTLDWEGGDVTSQALVDINSISTQYGIKFSNFINPRTFLDGVLTPDKRGEIRNFLLNRQKSGDELSLHIHMQYDLVREAGVNPITNHHWGLLSSTGYDVPGSDYSKDEFIKIVKFAKDLFIKQGFSGPVGYRAGGWFINSGQIQSLIDLGFKYDASGRNRPVAGAFRTSPWDLPVNAQPYFPNPGNQNAASPVPAGILEIPQNGNTNELSADELISRIKDIYSSGYLTSPNALVYISHPQFAAEEFYKIPTVINEINKISFNNDSGPAIFVTMDNIYKLWISLQ